VAHTPMGGTAEEALVQGREVQSVFWGYHYGTWVEDGWDELSSMAAHCNHPRSLKNLCHYWTQV
jgi:hypothetical protein